MPDVLPAGHEWELDVETLSVLWYEGPHTPVHSARIQLEGGQGFL